jgi:hypothetical protein
LLDARASFWTSGSSDKCPNSFGWCGSSDREFISYQSLRVQSFESSAGKKCVGATLQKNELVIQPEKCTTQRLIICEVYFYLFFKAYVLIKWVQQRESSKKCSASVCPNMNCTEEVY